MQACIWIPYIIPFVSCVLWDIVGCISKLPFTFLKVLKQEVKKEVKKYSVKPPKDLTSKFEAKIKAKKEAEEKERERKHCEEEDARIAVSWINNTFLETVTSFVLQYSLFWLWVHMMSWFYTVCLNQSMRSAGYTLPLTIQSKVSQWLAVIGVL